MDTMYRRKLLVTGCPRSGTRYVCRAFKRSLDVPHEKMGKDGTVSGLFAVDDWVYGTLYPDHTLRLRDVEFENIIHLVRHPLKQMASAVKKLQPYYWRWLEKHTGVACDLEPVILKAALFWERWNQICDDLAPDIRVRVEDFKYEYKSICEIIEIEPADISDIPENLGESFPDEITWDDVFSQCGHHVAHKLIKRAHRYGYE